MKKIKVNQLISIQSGNPIANQFEIYTNKGYYFQSYNSIIYYKCSKTGKEYLDKYKWDYSNTTGKYRNQILCEGIAETREKIKRKEYILKDLN
mgnify:CR=1 FL=1|tara:strand:- start:1413 stop:1691 length:279 start_codon:yes stop_codon:yes gene_type:complete